MERHVSIVELRGRVPELGPLDLADARPRLVEIRPQKVVHLGRIVEVGGHRPEPTSGPLQRQDDYGTPTVMPPPGYKTLTLDVDSYAALVELRDDLEKRGIGALPQPLRPHVAHGRAASMSELVAAGVRALRAQMKAKR